MSDGAIALRLRRGFSEAGLNDEEGEASYPPPHRSRGANYSRAETGCSRCELMFSENGLRELDSADGFRHSTFRECCASANKGCPACYFIAATIQRDHEGVWEDDAALTFRNRSSKTQAAACIDVLDGSLPTIGLVITIYPYAKQSMRPPRRRRSRRQLTSLAGTPAAQLIHRRPLRRDVQSKRVLDAARNLYKTCKDSHPQCRFARDAVLPSRVLDVGSAANPSLRLFLNETEQRGRYLALSYCWGGDQAYKLRRSNLSAMERAIDETKLQSSVRDAVAVTRRLGFRYLWVDALCIVQDCDDDKEREIGRMATVYRNAALTIAAGTAVCASDGFLDRSGPAYLPAERVDVPGQAGRTGTIYLRSGPYVPRHALDKRGWVLQEFLLSSRLLVFSEWELLWQCREVDLRGVTGSGDELEYLQPLESISWTALDENNPEAAYEDEGAEKRCTWKTIVDQYTLRELGEKEDRLNALRGITRELETLWGDVCCFGIWKRWFVELLAWYRVEEPPVRAPPGKAPTVKVPPVKKRSNRAPSWSWASLDKRIMHKEVFKRQDAVFKKVEEIEARVPRHAVLEGRVWNELLDDGDDEEDLDEDVEGGPRIVDYPDLADVRDEAGDRCVEYLLLGTVQQGRDEVGIALMVVEELRGYYKRVGLATFADMRVWEGVARREIKLK
ncbi:heterokaryon incompatibility protein (SNF2 family domain-containing protein) [Colletotrichum plurivorum]|uniref:Heterokaryon incompatibility protein (SNF2 family domain-containing protein) n=1 Tax=Colletotrichum plurivorum TaxID=2175906 RepID=A0A8H6KC24_9PEZI|nr:heterokaryon incompatibility protein (SNF2 family domain-containing protein) [Colletotrichum plurivorum]